MVVVVSPGQVGGYNNAKATVGVARNYRGIVNVVRSREFCIKGEVNKFLSEYTHNVAHRFSWLHDTLPCVLIVEIITINVLYKEIQ